MTSAGLLASFTTTIWTPMRYGLSCSRARIPYCSRLAMYDCIVCEKHVGNCIYTRVLCSTFILARLCRLRKLDSPSGTRRLTHSDMCMRSQAVLTGTD